MTKRETNAGFPGGCRDFLMRLDVMAESLTESDQHAVECARCQRVLREARHNVELLRGLEAPPVPEEVRSPAFLEGIYERASAELAQPLAPMLRAGLTRTRAPGDVSWLDEAPREELEGRLRNAMTRTRSPGWMWQRIRSVTMDVQPAQPRHLRYAASVAAAVLVSTLLVVSNLPGPELNRGTKPLIAVVFDEQSSPLYPSFSLDNYAEVGR